MAARCQVGPGPLETAPCASGTTSSNGRGKGIPMKNMGFVGISAVREERAFHGVIRQYKDGTAEDCRLQYYQGATAFFWRKSQFTPAALASRGPPNLPSEVFLERKRT
jgi:hypothetical protein